MLRIAGPPLSSGLVAQFRLQDSLAGLNQATLRLATLRRINSGRDDPAGLIASETIRAELASLEAASRSAQRGSALLDTADSAIGNAADLLIQIRENVVLAASDTTSEAERAALQLENDAAIDALEHLGHTTSFGGRQLLDGTASDLSFVVGGDPSDLATISLPHVAATQLGSDAGILADLRSGGSADIASGQSSVAFDIISGASHQLLEDRAEVGAFSRYTLDSAIDSTQTSVVQLSSALSQIRDADVAAESAALTRSLILVDTSTAALGLSVLRPNVITLLLGQNSP